MCGTAIVQPVNISLYALRQRDGVHGLVEELSSTPWKLPDIKTLATWRHVYQHSVLLPFSLTVGNCYGHKLRARVRS